MAQNQLKVYLQHQDLKLGGKGKGNEKGVIMENKIWALTKYNRHIIENNFTFQFATNQPILVSGKKSYLVLLHFSICSAIKYFSNHVDKQACLHHTCKRERKIVHIFIL
jgi:hypothetical protein